jgi:hypothetical protein
MKGSVLLKSEGEDEIKLDVKICMRMYIGFIWRRVVTNAELLFTLY